jgi:hypothetical protein
MAVTPFDRRSRAAAPDCVRQLRGRLRQRSSPILSMKRLSACHYRVAPRGRQRRRDGKRGLIGGSRRLPEDNSLTDTAVEGATSMLEHMHAA